MPNLELAAPSMPLWKITSYSALAMISSGKFCPLLFIKAKNNIQKNVHIATV